MFVTKITVDGDVVTVFELVAATSDSLFVFWVVTSTATDVVGTGLSVVSDFWGVVSVEGSCCLRLTVCKVFSVVVEVVGSMLVLLSESTGPRVSCSRKDN